MENNNLRTIMKNQYLFSTALAIAVVSVGCQKNETPMDNPPATNNPSVSDSIKTGSSNAWESTKSVATNTWANVKEGSTNAWAKTKEVTTNAWENLKETLQPAADYSYAKKDAFVADAQADLAALDQEIQTWSDKVAASSDSVKADAQAKLNDLKAQRATLDQKLDAVKASTEAGWEDTKTAFVNSYNDTKSSLKQAWQWLNDKLSS